jgi:hypothetical protein
MRLYCIRCGGAWPDHGPPPLGVCCRRTGDKGDVWTRTPYRLYPVTRVPFKRRRRHIYELERQCRGCARAIPGRPKLWMHLVFGGEYVCHSEDSQELEHDFVMQPGDMGLHEVCHACAELLPPGFVVERQGCTMPRTRTRTTAREHAMVANGETVRKIVVA